MSNLIRGRQDLLFNTLTPKDFGMYYEGGVATGAPHLVVKSAGIDISGDVSVTIADAVTGTKQKKTLTPVWVWDGSTSKTFTIEVTRQPLYTGFGHEQFPVSKTYSFTRTGFVTNTVGTLHNTDKEAIINGLVAAIVADEQLNNNAIHTGAVVTATRLNQTLVLEANEVGILFTVRNYGEWTEVENVAFKKNTLTRDDIARLFAVKAENEGQYVTQPLPDTEYVKIIIKQKVAGYDNTSATAYNTREQVYNLYIPSELIDDTLFAAIAVATGDPLVVASMADVVGDPDATLEDYLRIIQYPVLPQAVTGVYAKELATTLGTFDLGATVVVTPITANQAVTYASSDATKATVSSAGVVTGVAEGTTNITVTTVDGAQSFVCVITVPALA